MPLGSPIKETKIQMTVVEDLSVIPTYREVTTQPQLSHYLDNLKAITSNDRMDSHGEDRWTVT